jgi:hypothetical protein
VKRRGIRYPASQNTGWPTSRPQWRGKSRSERSSIHVTSRGCLDSRQGFVLPRKEYTASRIAVPKPDRGNNRMLEKANGRNPNPHFRRAGTNAFSVPFRSQPVHEPFAVEMLGCNLLDSQVAARQNPPPFKVVDEARPAQFPGTARQPSTLSTMVPCLYKRNHHELMPH